MDILALCRKMVILFFCMATGFAAAKGGAMDLQSNKKLSALSYSSVMTICTG